MGDKISWTKFFREIRRAKGIGGDVDIIIRFTRDVIHKAVKMAHTAGEKERELGGAFCGDVNLPGKVVSFISADAWIQIYDLVQCPNVSEDKTRHYQAKESCIDRVLDRCPFTVSFHAHPHKGPLSPSDLSPFWEHEYKTGIWNTPIKIHGPTVTILTMSCPFNGSDAFFVYDLRYKFLVLLEGGYVMKSGPVKQEIEIPEYHNDIIKLYNKEFLNNLQVAIFEFPRMATKKVK